MGHCMHHVPSSSQPDVGAQAYAEAEADRVHVRAYMPVRMRSEGETGEERARAEVQRRG